MSVEAPTNDRDRANDQANYTAPLRHRGESPAELTTLTAFDVEGLCTIAPETLQLLASVGC